MSISFSGLASGLDTSSWITSLTQLRQAKVTKLEEQKSSVVAAQSTLQGIRSYFASFRSSLEKITDSKFKVSSMDILRRNSHRYQTLLYYLRLLNQMLLRGVMR